MNRIEIKPKLSSFREISKYIKKIDTNRYYSNFGPLYQYTAKKISKDYGLKKNSLILTSSGHSSLLSCCLYLKKFTRKKYILVPSFNFYSAPQAILQSGYEPYFVDIEKKDFTINYDKIEKAFHKLKNNIAGIIAVSPFGYPLNIDKLNNIQKKFKTKVIYDAADTFINFDNNLDHSELLICCSFHPTKTLPSNESGLIICPNKDLQIIKNITSFGCNGRNKEIVIDGFNGKFSEYDAAIFLANYIKRDKIKKKLFKNIKYLNKKLNLLQKKDVSLMPNFGESWVSTKISCISKKQTFKSLKNKFSKLGIEIYSGWNNKPMHMHSFFKKCKKANLKITNSIFNKFFIIPMNIDISKKDMDLILLALKKIFK